MAGLFDLVGEVGRRGVGQQQDWTARLVDLDALAGAHEAMGLQPQRADRVQDVRSFV